MSLATTRWWKFGPFMILCAMEASAQMVSFLPHRDVHIGSNCCLVAAGDFDKDGKIDLVVSYGNTGYTSDGAIITGANLSWLRGDGNGGFLPPAPISSFPNGVSRLIASDVNRDGKLDLLLRQGDGQTYLLIGNGNGTFRSPSLVSQDHLMEVADLNGDGAPDLIVERDGPNGGLGIALGNGDGTFRQPLGFAGPIDGDPDQNVALGDLNGDGKLDVAWTSHRTSTAYISVALGNGDGTLQPFEGVFSLPKGSSGGRPIAIADVNNDGKQDIIVSGRNSDVQILFGQILFGNGDGTFIPAPGGDSDVSGSWCGRDGNLGVRFMGSGFQWRRNSRHYPG